MSQSPGSVLGAMSIRDFCQALSAKTPTPGGGAVAGVTAAHAASLLAMVIEYSRGKSAFVAHESDADGMLHRLREMVETNLTAAQADADAYAVLNRLSRKAVNDPERVAGWDRAVEEAIDAPQRIVQLSLKLTDMCRSLAGQTAKYLDSDMAIAADLAACAARAAAWNVRANLPSVSNSDRRIALSRDLDEQLTLVRDHVHSVQRLLDSRS